MKQNLVVAYIDGGSRGNPGPSGYGARIENQDGSIIEEIKGAVGIATNNVAEYEGLLAALSYLQENNFTNVIVRSDSQLLVKQMTGHFKVKHPNLKPLYDKAITLVGELDLVEFQHIPREKNSFADRLANEAMDEISLPLGSDTSPHSETSTPIVDDQIKGLKGTVLSIGIDIESISRIDSLLKQYGDRFCKRIFTNEELTYSLKRKHPAQHLAGRFAAKEAAMKALGTGRSQGVLWRDIEVIRDSGPPALFFHGKALEVFGSIGATRSVMSITHSGDWALAEVIFIS